MNCELFRFQSAISFCKKAGATLWIQVHTRTAVLKMILRLMSSVERGVWPRLDASLGPDDSREVLHFTSVLSNIHLPDGQAANRHNYIRGLVLDQTCTRCSTIAEKPRCRVRYSFGQKWKTGTGRQYYLQPLWYNRPANLSN